MKNSQKSDDIEQITGQSNLFHDNVSQKEQYIQDFTEIERELAEIKKYTTERYLTKQDIKDIFQL